MIKRIELSLLSLVVGAGIMLGAFRIGEALADGSGSAVTAPALDAGSAAAPLPDPIAAPSETLSMLTKLYKSGAWLGLSILVAFFALTIASKKVAWLKHGRRAVYCSAALGGLALLTVPATQGTTPNISMLVAAFGAAISLALNPTKPSGPVA